MMDNKYYIALRYVGASGMSVKDALEDKANSSMSSTLNSFYIKASELSQAADEAEETEDEPPTLTFDEMKGLMDKLGSSG